MKRFAWPALIIALILPVTIAVQSGQAIELEAAEASARITHEPLCDGTISPMQYGQFVEYLCDLVPAMWSEKLYDGSFAVQAWPGAQAVAAR